VSNEVYCCIVDLLLGLDVARGPLQFVAYAPFIQEGSTRAIYRPQSGVKNDIQLYNEVLCLAKCECD